MNDFNCSKKFSKWLEIKKWKLFDYQKEFFSCLSKNKYKQYIISSDTGTGKTITSFLPFLNYFCKGIKKNILYIAFTSAFLTYCFCIFTKTHNKSCQRIVATWCHGVTPFESDT